MAQIPAYIPLAPAQQQQPSSTIPAPPQQQQAPVAQPLDPDGYIPAHIAEQLEQLDRDTVVAVRAVAAQYGATDPQRAAELMEGFILDAQQQAALRERYGSSAKRVPKQKEPVRTAELEGAQPNNYGYTPIRISVTTVVKLGSTELRASYDAGGVHLQLSWNEGLTAELNHTAAFKALLGKLPQLNGKLFIAVPWSKRVTLFAEVHTPAVLIAGQ